jgi:hypothetical protein
LFVTGRLEGAMILWLGTYGFGAVMGWMAAYLFDHNRPTWREIKSAAGLVFGAAAQAVFGGVPGIVIYGIGVFIGVAFYGVTLLLAPLRHAHHISDE